MVLQAALEELLGCHSLVPEGSIQLLVPGRFNAALPHRPDVLWPQLLDHPLHVAHCSAALLRCQTLTSMACQHMPGSASGVKRGALRP